jgi:hypothetical protein
MKWNFFIPPVFVQNSVKLNALAVPAGHNPSIHAEQIQAGKSHNCIDNSGNPGHIAADKGHQVELEKSDQSPVNSPDQSNGKCRVIQT